VTPSAYSTLISLHDHDAFLFRLEGALEATQCRCYAWALMSNHFPLLIRTGDRRSVAAVWSAEETGRETALSHAKGLIAYWGYHELGIAGTELTQALGMSRTALSKAIARGEEHAKVAGAKLLS